MIYIYIYIYVYAKWYYFCRKVWVWMQEIILVEKWVWMQESWKDELSSLPFAIYICHPRYFVGLLGCTRNFPWSFLLYFFVFFLLCSYWLHFISSLTFSKKEDLRNSFAPISHGSMQIRNLHLTLLFFLLRKELGSSLDSFSQNPRSTPQKKDEASSHFFFIFSQRNQKTLSSSLPFFHEWFYVYFSPQET